MTTLLQLDADDVRRLLSMRECIALMERAFAALGRDEVLQPLRTVIHQRDGSGSLYVMPASTVDPAALAVKLITVFHGNHGRGLASHQGVVIAFDPATGTPAAMIEAGSLTAIRTAAVSGLATRLLARQDAHDLALVGSGVGAEAHLEAMRAVRPIDRVRVWSPTAAHRRAFARRMTDLHDIAVDAVDDAESAVRGADLICTVSAARVPVLDEAWVAPGAHINAVGASTPATREIDTATVRRARFFADSRSAALNEAGDLLIPIDEGVIGEDHIVAELSDLVLGLCPGRRTEDEVTLFEALGLAVEDAVAAAWLVEQARSS